jgi:basic amino acid/polyamine antiporter, APA family
MSGSSTTASATSSDGKLLRILGVGFGIAVALGSSIGAGIMRTPSAIAGRLPSVWLILLAWILGGVYSLLGAWALSEVGAMVPSAGAYYAIARRAYGDYISFVVGWTDWISVCGATAFISLLAGEYLGDLVPSLDGHTTALAAFIVVVLGLVQWRGIRWGSVFQDVTSAGSACILIVLVVAAFVHPHSHSSTLSATPVMPSGMAFFAAWMFVLQAVLGTYDGWYGALYFGDEIVNPGIELPRSFIRSVLLLAVLYVLINAALLYSLDMSQLVGENLPLARLGQIVSGERGVVAVRGLMTLILIAAANAAMLSTTRVLYAMSRDGWGPARLASVNHGGTPAIPLLLSMIASIAFLLSGSFNRVLAITAFLFVSKYLLSYLSVFVLRRREPNTPRPYLAYGHPWTTGVAVIGSLLFLVGVVAADTRNTFYGCLVLIASYPIYRLGRRAISPIRNN